jgi:hypothetical protein
MVWGCQLRETKLVVVSKELLLPERCVEEAFLQRPAIKTTEFLGEVMEMVTILLSQRNIMVQIIKVEDPPQPNDLDGVPLHCNKKQSLSNLPFIANVSIAVGETKGEGKHWKDCLHC